MTEKNEIWKLVNRLFPICRSLTGNGVRQTLHILQENIPLQIHEVPSGTKAFDWTVPNEWNIKDAYIKDLKGNKLIDFQQNNLHVVGYSIPFQGVISYKELEQHLHSLPNAIPYVTSYYQPYWGFCLTDAQKALFKKESSYEVKIDSTLEPGSLTYADLIIPGKSEKEILISTYICHPSLANNEVSGPVVATFLAKTLLQQKNLHYTYRFVFIPETIGSIVYLSLHKDKLKKDVIAGYVVTCVGDPNPFSYLQSPWENNLTDRMTRHILQHSGEPFKLYPFLDRGSDERQYCSPKIDLPVGSLMRTKYGIYPEYHTSLDNLQFITADALQGSIQMYLKCLNALDGNHIYEAVNYCEPQMGKRGLYPNLSKGELKKEVRVLMNLLAYSDGAHDLLAIAEKLNCSVLDLIPAATLLESHNLLKRVKK